MRLIFGTPHPHARLYRTMEICCGVENARSAFSTPQHISS
jgi:hypothetical protein